MLPHSGVKAHTCSECGKSFSLAHHLRVHMVTHTGEGVHKCAECGDSFGEVGHLEQHMLTHSGEKPHKCTQCDYACPRATTLRRHIKTHSLQKPSKSMQMVRLLFNDKIQSQPTYTPPQRRRTTWLQWVWKFIHSSTTSEKPPPHSLISAQNAVSQVLNPLISNNTWSDIQQQLTSIATTYNNCDIVLRYFQPGLLFVFLNPHHHNNMIFVNKIMLILLFRSLWWWWWWWSLILYFC